MVRDPQRLERCATVAERFGRLYCSHDAAYRSTMDVFRKAGIGSINRRTGTIPQLLPTTHVFEVTWPGLFASLRSVETGSRLNSVSLLPRIGFYL